MECMSIIDINTIMQHGDPHYCGLLRCFRIIGPPIPHSPTKYDRRMQSFKVAFPSESSFNPVESAEAGVAFILKI